MRVVSSLVVLGLLLAVVSCAVSVIVLCSLRPKFRVLIGRTARVVPLISIVCGVMRCAVTRWVSGYGRWCLTCEKCLSWQLNSCRVVVRKVLLLSVRRCLVLVFGTVYIRFV